ncbi:hypothetical protein ABPG75_002686 [Micractinium tetrahymenae]
MAQLAISRAAGPAPCAARLQQHPRSGAMRAMPPQGVAAFMPAPRKPRALKRVQPSSRANRALVVAAANGQLRVMIAGAPAAGKGTQCAKIVEKYGLVHISAGDLLRAEVAAGTPAGKKAKSFMDNGDLVPNEVVVEMVKNKLAEDEVLQKGWLLDGYPRSGEQAEAIEKEGIRPDVFLLINVPDELLIDRVVGRRSDPETGEIYHLTFKPPPPEIVPRLVQRSDDTEEKARNRLRTYHANVDAVIGYYKDQLVEIDGTQSMDAVFESIQVAIDGAAKELQVA